MITLNECKQFVLLHAKTLGVYREAAQLLPYIDSLEEESSGCWGRIFLNAAENYRKEDDLKKALGMYNLARFPFPSTKQQVEAYFKYKNIFKDEVARKKGLQFVVHKDKKFSYYYKAGTNGQLIIICGGIISLKEQWIGAFDILKKTGSSVILTEMPGVGENTIPYNNSCFSFFSELIDEVYTPHLNQCHILGISFSGYIALKNSITDNRISSVVMIGTPINSAYQQHSYFDKLPGITKEIMIHNISKSGADIHSYEQLYNYVREQFTPPAHIRDDLQVFYLQSEFDEVISSSEAHFLSENTMKFHLLSLPDVHGSPNFHRTVILFVLWSLLTAMKLRPLQRYLLKVFITVSKSLVKVRKKIGCDEEKIYE